MPHEQQLLLARTTDWHAHLADCKNTQLWAACTLHMQVVAVRDRHMSWWRKAADVAGSPEGMLWNRGWPLWNMLLALPCLGSGALTTAAPAACARSCMPRQTPSTGTVGHAFRSCRHTPARSPLTLCCGDPHRAELSQPECAPTSSGFEGAPGPGDKTTQSKVPSSRLRRISASESWS